MHDSGLLCIDIAEITVGERVWIAKHSGVKAVMTSLVLSGPQNERNRRTQGWMDGADRELEVQTLGK